MGCGSSSRVAVVGGATRLAPTVAAALTLVLVVSDVSSETKARRSAWWTRNKTTASDQTLTIAIGAILAALITAVGIWLS
jgi:hypothetical protein